MVKDSIVQVSEQSVLKVLGQPSSKIYTHSVFCQCVLPVRALPKDIRHYRVQHGNASLMFQAGCFEDDTTGKVYNQDVPAGAKARLLFSYIIDQAKRSGKATVDMGVNLHQFMRDNNIPIGGANAKEITRQVRNIASADISIGMWGETETHRFSEREQFKIAKKISFWVPKNAEDPKFWEPYITLSDDFMAAMEGHSVLLDIKPLIELQANPRAMDMYSWLTYRISSVKGAVKISYADLHNIFGQQTKVLASFKQDFKKALTLALPYVTAADLDLESDSKHIILRNNKHKIYLPSGDTKQISQDVPIEEGVFGELQAIGLSPQKIKELTTVNEKGKIDKALAITKQNISKGKVKNAPGFFTKALKEGWEIAEEKESAKDTQRTVAIIDSVYEDSIKDKSWKKVRTAFAVKYGAALFNNWIRDLNFVEKGEGEAIISAKNRFIAEEIKKTYLNDLHKFWLSADKTIKDVIITVAKNK